MFLGRTENRHVRWDRLTDNIGYMRLKTTGATKALMEVLRDQFDINESTLRVWHTKHLIIAWETEHK